MTLAATVGTDMSKFGTHAHRQIPEIGRGALVHVMKDASVVRDGIEEVCCGSTDGLCALHVLAS